MTNSCFSKQQWPNTAICLGWRREEFVYSMHWCVPLRGTESSPYFVSAVGGRFSVLNVRCDCPLWRWKQTVEYCIIQILSEMLDMLVSSCISFNKADKTIRELDRFSLEMSWTMDRSLGNEPFVTRYTIHLHNDTIWICINNYDQLWSCLGSCWKPINLYQPIITYRSTNSVTSIDQSQHRGTSHVVLARNRCDDLLVKIPHDTG